MEIHTNLKRIKRRKISEYRKIRNGILQILRENNGEAPADMVYRYIYKYTFSEDMNLSNNEYDRVLDDLKREENVEEFMHETTHYHCGRVWLKLKE